MKETPMGNGVGWVWLRAVKSPHFNARVQLSRTRIFRLPSNSHLMLNLSMFSPFLSSSVTSPLAQHKQGVLQEY